MKNILIFSDGTSENLSGGDDELKSNITKLYEISISNENQITKYDEGVGSKGFILGKTFAQITGYGIRKNIIELYKYICDNFEYGDKIYLFGFSRGAYTVRKLNGLISDFGIIRDYNSLVFEQIERLLTLSPIDRLKDDYYYVLKHKSHLRPIVEFIGVFDTIGALGIPIPFISKFLVEKDIICSGMYTTELHNVKYAYHALALDEYRSLFKPVLWTKVDDVVLKEIKQTWFIGSHTDVGGGYPGNDISNISLQWMLNKAIKAGAIFKQKELPIDHNGVVNDSYKMSFMYRLFTRFYRRPDVVRGYIKDTCHHTVKERFHDSKADLINSDGYFYIATHSIDDQFS